MAHGTEVNVRVISCFSPDNFWCQVVKEEDSELFDLMDKLGQYCESASSLSLVSVGSLCAAQFSQDNKWYRAVVTETADDEATVCFVDYGNVEAVEKASLKMLSNDLIASVPMQAFRCRLAGVLPVDKGDGWDKDACTRLEELLVYDESKTFTASIVAVHSCISNPTAAYATLSLMDGEQSIGDILIEGGYAQAQTEVEANIKDYIDDIVSEAIEMARADDLIGTELNFEDVLTVTDIHKTDDIVQKVSALALSNSNSYDNEDRFSSESVGQAVRKAVKNLDGVESRTIKVGERVYGYYVGTGTPDKITIFLTNIQSPAETQNLEDSIFPSAGLSCLVKSSKDDLWYKATIVDVAENHCKVFLLCIYCIKCFLYCKCFL